LEPENDLLVHVTESEKGNVSSAVQVLCGEAISDDIRVTA